MPDWERRVIQTITIEREYGSGAGTISRKLAEKLGWALWDEKITQEIARRLKCDVKSVEQREEKPDSTFYRLMKIFMRGSYERRHRRITPIAVRITTSCSAFAVVVSDRQWPSPSTPRWTCTSTI